MVRIPSGNTKKTRAKKKRFQKTLEKKKRKLGLSRYSRRESRLIILFGDDLLAVLVQRGGNIKRGQDARDRDPVRRATHEPARTDAPSVSERDVGGAQRGAPSGQIAFGDEALRVRTYVCLVVQYSAGQKTQ